MPAGSLLASSGFDLLGPVTGIPPIGGMWRTQAGQRLDLIRFAFKGWFGNELFWDFRNIPNKPILRVSVLKLIR